MTLKHAVYILGIFLIMFVMGCPLSPFLHRKLCTTHEKICIKTSPLILNP
jgi:hypothetical protein